jgi:hypothetical protein
MSDLNCQFDPSQPFCTEFTLKRDVLSSMVESFCPSQSLPGLVDNDLTFKGCALKDWCSANQLSPTLCDLFSILTTQCYDQSQQNGNFLYF